MIAILTSVFVKSISSGKSRGTFFFIFGVVSIVFFDHDVQDTVIEHPEGVHKSLLIHRIYELFIHLGLSDHKFGAILLLISACAEAGFTSAARTLAASIGGAKRLHVLSTCASVFLILLVSAFAAFFGTIFFHREPSKLDIPLTEFSYSYGFFATLVVVLVFVADFYFTEFMIRKAGPNSVQRASYPCLAITAFLISACINGSVVTVSASVLNPDSQLDPIFPDSSLSQPAHYLSTGVILALVAFLYSSSLLTRSNTDITGGGRRFVGFSPAGLPLYTPQAAPSTTGGGDGESLSFAYHAVATLKQVTADKASFRIFVFLCLNLSFTFIELFYGVWTNSLGLISDGFHMLFDCAALVMGLYASVVGRWKPTRIYSFGFHRAEILSGFINSLALMVISSSIFVNALERIHQPPDINTDRLMAVSVGGLLVNLVGMFALGHTHSHGGGSHGHSHGGGGHGHSHGSAHGHGSSGNCSEATTVSIPSANGLTDIHDNCDDHDFEDASGDSNLRGVYLHVLADTLGSVGVIISSFFVTNYGWNIADPICSLFISGFITYSALPLIKDTLLVLALRVPSTSHPANPQRILKKVLQVEYVLEVVNPCIWQNTEDSICCSMRLRIAPEAVEQVVLARVKDLLKRDQINHLTIQLEKNDFYQHMEVLNLHLDTISRHSKSTLSETSKEQNHHNCSHDHHHHHHEPTITTHVDGSGWTTVKF
nr:zinc transporter 5 [Hymenolepis microstoma]